VETISHSIATDERSSATIPKTLHIPETCIL
jgi:hypothetical protein